MNKQQKLVIVVSILAAVVTFLDTSIINVALPAIRIDLGGNLSLQQWVVDAYFIALGSLILLAGSLSDLFGRKKILVIGLVGFAITSILCAIAPSALFLIVARLLQGATGALLVPSSLALIMSTFSGSAQGKAVGIWTGWTSVSFVIGPLLGGLLVDAGSWRIIFAINIIPIAITLWLMRGLKNEKSNNKIIHVDYFGALLGTIGLAGPVYGLIEQPEHGWGSLQVYLPILIGLVTFLSFLFYEHRTKYPMLPLQLFKARNFSVGNVATTAIYSGLTVAIFLIAIYVQQVGGYSALQAGLSLMPVTVIMFLLAPRFGDLGGKFGPRLFMAVGPVIAGSGFLLMLRVDENINYASELLPGVLVFGLGLSATVPTLTSAVLGAIKPAQAGIASAVNNAISRVAGLAAVAAIGVVIGPNLDLNGFRHGITIMAFLLILGGVISAVGIRNHQLEAGK